MKKKKAAAEKGTVIFLYRDSEGDYFSGPPHLSSSKLITRQELETYQKRGYQVILQRAEKES